MLPASMSCFNTIIRLGECKKCTLPSVEYATSIQTSKVFDWKVVVVQCCPKKFWWGGCSYSTAKKCSLPVFSFLDISESADSEMCCICSKNLCLVTSYSCLKFSFQHCPVSEIYEFTTLFQYHLALAPTFRVVVSMGNYGQATPDMCLVSIFRNLLTF